MTSAEVRDMTSEELLESLDEAREERFNLRFQLATNQLDNTARIKAVKKDIARIQTEMRVRESASSTDKAAPASSEAADAAPAEAAKESA